MAIILFLGGVIAMESINTSIENIANFVSPEKHEAIAKIKDLSAAGVLASAIAAAIVGLVIFVPKIARIYTI